MTDGIIINIINKRIQKFINGYYNVNLYNKFMITELEEIKQELIEKIDTYWTLKTHFDGQVFKEDIIGDNKQ